MQIPFYRAHITQAEIDEVVATLRSGWLTTGPKTKTFEEEFGRYIGVRHSVAVNSCTAALHLALEALGLKEGEGVVVPTMTFAATAEVVRYFKAVPILVDCRPNDLNMDVADARNRLEVARKKGVEPRVIIPMHYGGQMGDITGVIQLAREQNLRIVEDAAHCCPAKYRVNERAAWQGVGSFSDISCFSFYANKCLTTGEGGMACTNDAEYADRMRIMSLHGISRDAWKRFTAEGNWYYEIVAPGFKYNLTDIAAAIGIHQLRKADFLHSERERVALRYRELLLDVEEIILPQQVDNRIHSWHLFPIRLKLGCLRIDRAGFIAELKRLAIGTSVHWMPLHMHPYYRQMYNYQTQDFPVAADAYEGLISLPVYPLMNEEEIGQVATAVRDLITKNLKPAVAVYA